jgi:hypothetical protein
LDIVGQPLDYVGERRHRLDAGVPILLLHRAREGFVLQVFVFLQPLLKLDDLQRIGGSYQRLTQKLVGIKGNRRD